MSEPDNAPSPTGVLTLSDPDYYPAELKVLEDLDQRLGQQTIAEVCRDHNIDQYDFKDRWSSLLRHNEPAELLAKIRHVKDLIGNDVSYIAKKLGYTQSCVRTIVKKMQERPEDQHRRTKNNLAHRMMPLCGGSLKKAHAKLHRKRKSVRKYSTDDESDSSSDTDSESDEEYGAPVRKPPQVRVEKVSGSKIRHDSERPAPKPKPPVQKKEPVVMFEAAVAMVEDPDTRLLDNLDSFLSPKTQMRILADTPDYSELQKACQTHDVDFTLLHKAWKPLLDFFTRSQLEAFLYSLLVLYRLGYGYSVISDALNIPRSIVVTALRNLHLAIGSTHGSSFDVTVLLVRKEVMTSSRIADTCGVPKEVGRLIIKRCGQREEMLESLQNALDEVSTSNKIMWLFERGLSVTAICQVLKVPEKVVNSACPEDA